MAVVWRRVIVTGSAGFVARHFIAQMAAAENAPEVIVGLDVRPSDSPALHRACDLTNLESAQSCLRESEPDVVVHFAGVTQGVDLDSYFRVNVSGTHNLLQAAAALPRAPLIVTVGSASQYGPTSGTELVLNEECPQLARGAYGLSKVLQEKWAGLYAEATKLPVIGVRIFNIIGPGQPSHLVPAAFLAQVADVISGKRSQIDVGNVETRRDFIDVRDATQAVWRLVSAFQPGMNGQFFNIASGEGVRIRDLVEASIALSGRAIPIVVDPSRFRANDVASVIGDNTKLREATGWRPTISWRESLHAAWNARR